MIPEMSLVEFIKEARSRAVTAKVDCLASSGPEPTILSYDGVGVDISTGDRAYDEMNLMPSAILLAVLINPDCYTLDSIYTKTQDNITWAIDHLNHNALAEVILDYVYENGGLYFPFSYIAKRIRVDGDKAEEYYMNRAVADEVITSVSLNRLYEIYWKYRNHPELPNIVKLSLMKS